MRYENVKVILVVSNCVKLDRKHDASWIFFCGKSSKEYPSKGNFRLNEYFYIIFTDLIYDFLSGILAEHFLMANILKLIKIGGVLETYRSLLMKTILRNFWKEYDQNNHLSLSFRSVLYQSLFVSMHTCWMNFPCIQLSFWYIGCGFDFHS